MLDVLTQFVLGYIIGLSGALIPGPFLVFVVTNSLNYGKAKTGFVAGIGHCIVEAFIITAIILGLTVLLKSSLFQLIIGLVGGVALVIFGVLNLITVKGIESKDNGSKFSHNSLIGGVVFTVFNATIPLWWSTVGLTMLNQALTTTTLFGVAFWILGHWSADLSWYSFIGYSVSKGRNYIGEKVHRVIILLCGFILISVGLFFLGSTIPKLF